MIESESYVSWIGSIMYDMHFSRANLAYAFIFISKFMKNTRWVHWRALKWILRYLNGSLKDGLNYTKEV